MAADLPATTVVERYYYLRCTSLAKVRLPKEDPKAKRDKAGSEGRKTPTKEPKDKRTNAGRPKGGKEQGVQGTSKDRKQRKHTFLVVSHPTVF